MLGHVVSAYLKEKGHDVKGFARNRSLIIPSFLGDIKNVNCIYDIISTNYFDAVINCIGVLNSSAEVNKSDAVFLNSYLPHYLVDICAEYNIQVIHMSTDCVFSGKSGNYKEYDLRDGETFYDRSKALGEIDDNKNITLRSSIVGPDLNKNGIGLLNWFLQQSDEVVGYTKAIWNGQTTLQIAKEMEYIAKEKYSGLVNIVPDLNISKYELLKLFNKYFCYNEIRIIPSDKVVVNKTLVKTRDDINITIPDYERMIYELSDWVKKHKEWYNHYFTKRLKNII